MKAFIKEELAAYRAILMGRYHTLSTSIYRHLFTFTFVLMFIILPLLSMDMGMNGDERFGIPYSKQVLNFYLTFGEDRSFVEDPPGPTTYLKGAMLEATTALFNKVLGHTNRHTLAFHQTRHVIIAFFGLIAMLFTGLLGRTLGGWRAGWLALLFVFLSPRFMGHAMINPKDLPFATGYIMSLYFFVKIFKELPYPRKRLIVGAIIGIATAMGARSGGILLIVYLGFFSVMAFLYHLYQNRSLQYDKKIVQPALFRLAVTIVLGYAAGLLFWPYGLIDPISNPVKAIMQDSNFHVNMPVLFNGEKIQSTNPPWDYVPHWIAVTTPFFFHIGLLLFVLLSYRVRKWLDFKLVSMIFFVVLFPVVYIIYKNSTLYDGWRHTMFIYPPLIGVTSVGWEALLRSFTKSKVIKWIIGGLLVLLMAEPFYWIVRSHPHQYVYFNHLVGGLKGAYGYYETDYWMTSVKNTTEWLVDHANFDERKDFPKIASDCGISAKVILKEANPDIKVKYTRYYDRIKKDWKYGIYYSRFVGQQQMQNGTWPPNRTIYAEKVDGVPLSIVVERKKKWDYKGSQAMKQGNYQQAIQYFQKALQQDAQNEAVYLALGKAYINAGQNQPAIQALRKCLQIYPDYDVAQYFLGTAYFRAQQLDKAIQAYQRSGVASGYVNIGIIYAQQQQFDSAIYYLKKAIDKQPGIQKAYLLLARIYKQKGNNAMAKKYQQAAKQLQQKK